MTLAVRLRDRFGAGRKTRNRLLFVVLKHFEIILGEVANVISFFVRHDRVDQHQLGFFFYDRGGLLVRRSGGGGRRRRRLLLCLHWLGIFKEQERCDCRSQTNSF